MLLEDIFEEKKFKHGIPAISKKKVLELHNYQLLDSKLCPKLGRS